MKSKFLKSLVRWAFSEELSQLETITKSLRSREIQLDSALTRTEKLEAKLKNIFLNLDVSVDVHHYSKSWAVISLQGKSCDYIKFVDLDHKDIMEIAGFISRFDREKVDATPNETAFIKLEANKYRAKNRQV